MKEKDESAMIKEIIESQRCILSKLESLDGIAFDDMQKILDLQCEINQELDELLED